MAKQLSSVGSRVISVFAAVRELMLITNMKFPASKLILCINKFCLDEWQDIWDCCSGNKLHANHPTADTATRGKHSSSTSE